MAQKHSRQLLQLNMVVPNAVLDSWERKIKSWDAVGSKKKHAKDSPYRDPMQSKHHGSAALRFSYCKLASAHTLAGVRLNLANEEAAERKSGMIACHEMSPTNFILSVFDIEEKM